jgi:hypothetical protein
VECNSAAQPIIRNDLQGSVVDQYRKIHVYLPAPAAARCDNSRANKNRSDPGIVGSLTTEAIHIFAFVGNNELQPDSRLAIAHQIVTGAAIPGEIVSKMILVQSVPAKRELHVGIGEKFL